MANLDANQKEVDFSDDNVLQVVPAGVMLLRQPTETYAQRLTVNTGRGLKRTQANANSEVFPE